MGNYGGIQLPTITGEKLDSEKERRQILNYLALLDEKLRYMFQNIDIEENLSDDAKELFFKYGEDIANVIKDTEGNFSMLRQTINDITATVQDNSGNISLVQQTAERLATRISNAEGDVADLEQTASSLRTRISNAEDDISTVEQKANKIDWIVKSGTSESRMTLTDSFLEIVADNIDIHAEVRLYDEMKIYSADTGSTYGGYLSYGSGNYGGGNTEGVMLSSKDQYSYFIATNKGVRMTYDGDSAVYCISNGVHLVAGSYSIFLDDSYGNLCPDDDDEQLLGKSNRRWQGLYAGNATIQTSDRKEKNSINYDMEKFDDFFMRLQPCTYKMNNGTSGRDHVGFIAQDVEQAMDDSDLSSLEFAGFIKTPVHEVELENGNYDESTPVVDYDYALRYEEFAALNTHMIQKLMQRVEQLEKRVAELEGR